MLVVYNGLYHVLKQALNNVVYNDMLPESYSWFLSENTLFRHDFIPDKFKRNQDQLFPCLNKSLHEYLKSELLKDFMHLDKNWVREAGISLYEGNESLSLMKFGDQGKEKQAFDGLKKFGPLSYSPATKVIFFFIVHQNNIPLTFIVNDYQRGNTPGFSGVNKLTGVNHNTQANFSIGFEAPGFTFLQNDQSKRIDAH